jgi:predicted DNA-binding ribbon-helix-helix protein
VNGAIRKRSVTIDGHATSVSLEETFWQALAGLAADRKLSINALVSEIDRTRAPGAVNLSSAIRVFVLEETQRRMNGETSPSMTEVAPPTAISS